MFQSIQHCSFLHHQNERGVTFNVRCSGINYAIDRSHSMISIDNFTIPFKGTAVQAAERSSRHYSSKVNYGGRTWWLDWRSMKGREVEEREKGGDGFSLRICIGGVSSEISQKEEIRESPYVHQLRNLIPQFLKSTP
ncbi:unnamed protein product [Prunus armeniaca]|uniref:Uncharacterized protein n=1 Tax=Prunus armeniaca TaxID=36596 RepID=A0A6J5V7Z5_PRUAR|nr:unnamed protein product [Prunus armeniaca]